MVVTEICCGSYEDACTAEQAGADRIELNNALYLGGLTPSLGTLRLVKKNLSVRTICMVRPRGAGFCYTDSEYETMLTDCEILMENGADGIAFGFLRHGEDGLSVDEEKTASMIRIIRRYGGEAVFHRAFDCVDDPFQAAETLIRLGIDRVLTSGLCPKAEDGIPLLKELQQRYGDRIQFLAGSGVHAGNIKKLVSEAGITQVHGTCKMYGTDESTAPGKVSYAYLESGGDYEKTSQELADAFVRAARQAGADHRTL